MEPIHDLPRRLYQNSPASILGAVVIACMGVGSPAAKTFGDPPKQPLDAPFYSFDGDSPTVVAGTVAASDILRRQKAPPPGVAVPGAALGLVNPDDEIDALSSKNNGFGQDTPFMLLFSVDRNSVGMSGLHPELGKAAVPYYATEQAVLKDQGPGDQYMPIRQFTLSGGPEPAPGGSRALDYNTLIRNQYNEGGSDFGGYPHVPAANLNVVGGEPAEQDEVNSMMLTDRSRGGIAEVYFSVTKTSSSPGLNRGADIFYGHVTTVYASAIQLGLTPDDDIDGIIVFDDLVFGVFDEGDIVLFSLAPGSPSLSGLGTPADVFKVVKPPEPNPVVPTLFAAETVLGLGAPDDDVDALDYFVCEYGNAATCAKEHGIRLFTIPAVSEWGLVVMALLGMAAGTIMFRAKRRAAAA